MQRRAFISVLSPLSVFEAPSGGAAAGAGKDAHSALAMDDCFDISDLDSMGDAGPTAIESASFDSDGWVSVGRSQGVGGWGGGGWLSGLSAASVASPAPVERGGKDLSDSSEEEGREEEEEE